MNGIEADLRADVGRFRLEVAFSAPARGVTAVVGPSGAGKTTLLRCIAGLTPAAGSLSVNGECWQGDGVFVPTHRRAVGYVFQESSLFTHLNVERNLRYGFDRVPEADRRIFQADVVRWLGIERLLERIPAHLSGGERQRVAIARALLSSPKLLLMDEPVASLDGAGRREILPYLERLPRDLSMPIVYVGHSLKEVARLADRVIWMEGGVVRQAGPANEILTRLDLAGNQEDDAAAVVCGVVASHDDRFHLSSLDSPCGTLQVPRVSEELGANVRVRILARDVSLSLDAGGRSTILNAFPARVVACAETHPGQVLVRLACGERDEALLLARITAKSRHALGIAPGTSVVARVKSMSLAD